jgi:hypothetical protein
MDEMRKSLMISATEEEMQKTVGRSLTYEERARIDTHEMLSSEYMDAIKPLDERRIKLLSAVEQLEEELDKITEAVFDELHTYHPEAHLWRARINPEEGTIHYMYPNFEKIAQAEGNATLKETTVLKTSDDIDDFIKTYDF